MSGQRTTQGAAAELEARRRQAELQVQALRDTVHRDLEAASKVGRTVVPVAALAGAALFTGWVVRKLLRR